MKYFICLLSILIITSSSNAQEISELSLLKVASNTQERVSSVLSSGINVILFIDASCPYIEAYQQRISELDQLLKRQGYKFILVNPHQLKLADKNSLDAMKQQSKKYGWVENYYSDKEQKLAHLLNATKTPEVFIVNRKDTNLEIIYAGAIDDNPQNEGMVNNEYLKNALLSIKEGKQVKTKKIPAIGCRILKF